MGEKVGVHITAAIGENSMMDIRKYFERDARPLAEHEFKDFWMSLTEVERNEFRKADLSK